MIPAFLPPLTWNNKFNSWIKPFDLSAKAQTKLQKLEDELANTNFLIDSGIGSKADKAALRKTKRQLRDRRIQLWKQLEALPALLDERKTLVHDLDVLRQRHGIL